MEETLLIQIPDKEARRLVKTKGKGSDVLLECDGREYHVLIRDISCNMLSNQIVDMTFEKLDDGEKVSAIVFKTFNK